MKIDELRIPEELKEMIKSVFNIDTVKELLEIPCKDLYKAIEDPVLMDCNHYFNAKIYQRSLARCVHALGESLKGEYEDIQVSRDVAFTKILDLDMSVTLKNILIRFARISIFGELLTYDYEDLKKLRGMGVVHFQELKDYVHGLGYRLMNEESSIEEFKNKIRENGLKLLEDEGIPMNICGLLYKNNIFTIEDLKSYGPEVFDITGLGSVKKQRLVACMQEIGVEFYGDIRPESTGQSLRIGNDDIKRVDEENKAILRRIQEKESLIAEYNNLMKERELLLQHEQELDAKIQEMSERIKGVSRERRKD